MPHRGCAAGQGRARLRPAGLITKTHRSDAVLTAGQGLRQQRQRRDAVCTASPCSHPKLCERAVPLRRSQLGLSPGLCLHPGVGCSEASSAALPAGSPAGFVPEGCPSLSSSAPAPRSSAARRKKSWGSSCFSPAINFYLCFLIYRGMNCINRTVSCSLRFISLRSFQFVFISIIIRAPLTWPVYFYQIYDVMDKRRCSVNMMLMLCYPELRIFKVH